MRRSRWPYAKSLWGVDTDAFLSIVKVGRVFRLIKLAKYSNGFKLVARTMEASLEGLSMLMVLSLSLSLCVYVCVYACVCVCMCVRTYVCMYVCMYTHTHTHTQTRTHTRTHTHAHAHRS